MSSSPRDDYFTESAALRRDTSVNSSHINQTRKNQGSGTTVGGHCALSDFETLDDGPSNLARRLLLFLHRLPDLPVHDLELPDHTNRNCPAGANVRALCPSPPHWVECRGGDRHVGVHPHRAAG